MDEVSVFDDLDLDRKFLNLSAGMANFFSWTYGWLGGRLVAPIDPNKFDNASSKAAEVGVRALIVLGAFASLLFAGTYILLGAVVLSAGAKIFRSLGYYFQKDGFTHIRGSAPEKVMESGHAKIMEWNIRGHGGGLHYAEGGVIHWRSRLDRIVDSILKEDPDVIVLQEIYDTSLIESLVERLGGQYAHFYTHLGANIWGNESGIMVITKCAVHRFSHTDFNKTDEKVKRSFETLEIKANPELSVPCARIISTQLSPGKTATDLRMSQVAQIVDTLAREKLALPTLFVGSLNVDRDSMEEGSFLSNYLFHSYLDSEPTHSDELVGQWAPVFEGQEESSDFISFFKRNPEGDCRTFPVLEKGIRLIDSHIVRGFDENYNTKTALSDHHAVVTELSGLRAH
ncbi:MAG: hypothetical protein K1X28_07680 [Parachlamydiales bacterium]|nr:hypothetical protein [Parachlamydiales bacterium]